jgi:hypothetical protein
MLLSPIPFEYAKLIAPGDRVRRTPKPVSTSSRRVRRDRAA